MKTELVRCFLKERLQTTEQMEIAARLIDVSLATMYRYKANPEVMPLEKLSMLAEHFAMPLQGTATWSQADVIQGERRRFELEKKLASATGTRYAVTPSFSVNCELENFTRKLWESDYPMRDQAEMAQYLNLRKQRQQLYYGKQYQSYELIIANSYRDFFEGKGRFQGLPNKLRDQQLTEILRTLEFPHVRRRVYLPNTPELPIFTCYSTQTAVIRVDDLTVELGGADVVSELTDIFKDYFERANLKTTGDVANFLKNPS